jgi:hypothetical protein
MKNVETSKRRQDRWPNCGRLNQRPRKNFIPFALVFLSNQSLYFFLSCLVLSCLVFSSLLFPFSFSGLPTQQRRTTTLKPTQTHPKTRRFGPGQRLRLWGVRKLSRWLQTNLQMSLPWLQRLVIPLAQSYHRNPNRWSRATFK